MTASVGLRPTFVFNLKSASIKGIVLPAGIETSWLLHVGRETNMGILFLDSFYPYASVALEINGRQQLAASPIKKHCVTCGIDASRLLHVGRETNMGYLSPKTYNLLPITLYLPPSRLIPSTFHLPPYIFSLHYYLITYNMVQLNSECMKQHLAIGIPFDVVGGFIQFLDDRLLLLDACYFI